MCACDPTIKGPFCRRGDCVPPPQAADKVELSGGARETLRCLFFHGPTEDGDIPSKAGRGELVDGGHAERRSGFAYLTASGVQLALSLNFDRAKERWQRDRGVGQLIVTAPKDAEIVLVRVHADGSIVWVMAGCWSATRKAWFCRSGEIEPTHWLPKPHRWMGTS